MAAYQVALVAAVALIGLVTVAVYYWHQAKSEKAALSAPGPSPSGAVGEIGLIARDARAALANKGTLSHLPVILILGAQGSAKTSSVVYSGVESDLVAGNVFQENVIAPTRAANIWYARGVLLVEAAGRLLGDPAQFSLLLKKLRPGSVGSALGSGRQAPRAAVVCFSCEELVNPGAAEAAQAAARSLRTWLEETSRSFGARLPVYVLFTKSDRIPSFTEFAGGLGNEEIGQVLGVTLPVQPAAAAGVYSERETARLTDAFNGIFYSLCAKRPEFLGRENDPAKLPSIYEFPRELRKVRPVLVQFLAELCRPSQLTAGPFLRGFYFSGVRAITTQEAVARPVAPQPAHELGGATATFQTPFGAPVQPPAATARRVPQWLFLPHLFAGVLLADGEAMGASGGSTRTSRLRRLLLAAAAALALCYAMALTVSFFGNRSIAGQTVAAARALASVEDRGGMAPPLEALQKLDVLRQSVETLAAYERDGAPWRLRWGLYAGQELYASARSVYFRRFHQMLFGATQAQLVAQLSRLPASPGPNDEYGPVYDALKAYLITTSNHDKSTRMFLSPVLIRCWLEGRSAEPERLALVQKQFDFYAEELKTANPFSSENDSLSVERGRRYLSQFTGGERVYQFMLTEASRQNPSVNFNRQFPGSANAVLNTREVRGAFTKGGFAFMQNALKNADRFFAGEQWVLGDQRASAVDRSQLEQQLRSRYTADFLGEWRAFLKSTSVLKFANLKDAVQKLNLISGNQSPLLAAFWLASQNTAVDSADIKNAFQPVQFVVPPENKDRYIAPSNSPYMNSLVGLQAAVEQAAAGTGGANGPLMAQVNSQASGAKVVTRQVAQNFHIDAEGQVHAMVQKLMEDPILQVESLVRGIGPAELNAKAGGFCAQFRDLMSKYPFQAGATRLATIQEVNAIFQPGQGALWLLYDSSLKNYLTKQGAQYVPKPDGGVPLNPAFVNFFNHAAAVSETLYPGGSQTPNLSYTLRMGTPQGLQSLAFSIDNQTVTASKGKLSSKGFSWPGGGSQEVKLVGKFGSGPDITFTSYSGLWAVFQFFGDADRWQTSGSASRLEWVLRQGRAGTPLRLPDGSALVVQFDLETPGAAPVFQKGFLGGLACVARAAP